MMSSHVSRIPRCAKVASPLLVLASLLLTAGSAPAQETYQMPPPELAALVDAPLTPEVSLSPDGSALLLMERPSLPTIAEVSAPELRLAGLRINPRTNGPSRARPFSNLALRTLDGRERPIVGLPPESRIRNVDWSPDGAYIAFTLDRDDRIEMWVAEVASARARRLLDAAVNDAYYGSAYGWVSDSRTLVVRTIPEGRGPAPDAPRVPVGPVIQESTG